MRERQQHLFIDFAKNISLVAAVVVVVVVVRL